MYFKVGAAMRHPDHAPVRPQVSQLLRAFERGGSPVRGNFHTGLSKRNCAKFRELSHNFLKLADWALAGHFAWPHWGREFSNREQLFCTTLYIPSLGNIYRNSI